MNALLDKALADQKVRKLNDTQYAAFLKVPRSVWRMAKSGRRDIGLALLRAFAQASRDFDPYILAFLRDGQPPLPGLNPTGSQPPAAPLPAGEHKSFLNRPVPTGRVQP